MKEILNRRIKHRESFRPFAPSILAEATGEYFAKSHPSPFMTLAYPVRPEKREKIPAPTHVDGTGRLQTVTREANSRYQDRKSTRLNSSHGYISYAVFCLKKKKTTDDAQ